MMGKQNRIRIGKRTIAILLAGILCLLSGFVIWYQNYYDIPALTMADLAQLDLSQAKKLMIVAHPDDETLWGGAHLLEGDYLIVCLTHGSDAVRSAELRSIAAATGNACLILQYPDKTFGRRDDWSNVEEQIEQDITLILEDKSWESVVTHNKAGEYGHIHHKMTHELVTEAYQHEQLQMPLYCFGTYYSAKRLPEFEAQLPRISEEDLQKKEALLQNYKSQERVVEHLSHMNPYENWTLYDPAEEAES